MGCWLPLPQLHGPVWSPEAQREADWPGVRGQRGRRQLCVREAAGQTAQVWRGLGALQGILLQGMISKQSNFIYWYDAQKYHGDDKAGWQGARNKCKQEHAADLVVVDSDEENDFVFEFGNKNDIHVWIGIFEYVSDRGKPLKRLRK